MPRKGSEAVPEGNEAIPLYVLPGGISLEDFRRIWSETMDKSFDKHIGIIRKIYESHFDQLEIKLDETVEEMTEEQNSVKQA